MSSMKGGKKTNKQAEAGAEGDGSTPKGLRKRGQPQPQPQPQPATTNQPKPPTDRPPQPPLPSRRKAELLLQVEGNKDAFMKLLYATLLMILVPVPTYFLIYHGSSWVGLGWEDNVKAVAGGVGAVCTVQLIIIGYIISAFRE